MTVISSTLQQHIDRPYDNRSLDVEHGKGFVFDKVGHAMELALTLDRHYRVADVAYRSVGSSVLLGCGSFLTCVLRGKDLEFAQAVKARDLARILQLDKWDEHFAAMAVTALQRAVNASKKEPSSRLPLDRIRVGIRRTAWVPPPMEASDQRLLRRGETLDGLRHERTRIYNDLLNLDLLFHVVFNSSADIEGKWLACPYSVLTLKTTVPMLSEPQRTSVVLLGLLGETDKEVAAQQGVAPSDVLGHMWEVAGQVQRDWRGGREMGYPYSDLLMNHFMHPRHAGILPNASGCAELKNNTCGDRTRIYVRIEQDAVRAATFLAAGCGPGIACADYLLERVIGHPLDDALAVSVREVSRALQLPKEKLHAAELAVAALHAAVDDHRAKASISASGREG